MTDETEVFNTLKRIPYDEMLQKLSSIHRTSPVVSIGGNIFKVDEFYGEPQRTLERVFLLEQNGWSPIDFFMESEKIGIVSLVREFNELNKFPEELLERAKRFYPNAKFVEAHIELE